jgi:diguanylate cyclase (GGDEF)-like protein
MLIFSLVYTHQRQRITPIRIFVFWLIPVFTVILANSRGFQKLIWNSITLNQNLNLLVYQHGSAFWVYTFYAYLCVAISDIILIREYRQAIGFYKAQISAIIAGTIFPWLGSIVYLFGFDPVPGLDTTIVAFALTGIILTIAITQSRLFDLLPIAHNLLLQNMQDGVIVIDPSNRVVEMNPSAAFLLDKLALPLGGGVQETFQQWPDLVSALVEKSRLPVEIFLPGSIPRFLDIRVTSITDIRSDKNDGYLAVMRDITDRKQAESVIEAKSRELERISVTDDLTSLFNRRQANRFLDHEFQISERYNHPLTLVLIDIDDFKQINDRFGHRAGDEIIRSVANILRNNIRTTDLAARMGGDEFLMVMPDTEMDKAWSVMDRIRTTVQTELPIITQSQISISAGITCWFRGDSPDDALERVDRLLYKAKDQGKNCIVKDG